MEDVHFCTSYFDPLSLAHKALHVNLSDVAAMGATPLFVLGGISIPMLHQEYAKEFLHNFADMCENTGIKLIGGDITASRDRIFISVTIIGVARTKAIKYRCTAKPTNIICVVGELGYAHLGLIACEKSLSEFGLYKKPFLRPTAKTKEGIWLAEQDAVTCMMDISDGLLVDLRKLCKASDAKGVIDLELLNPSIAFREDCAILGLDCMDVMLTGGEDYGLLCAIDVEKLHCFAKDFAKIFGYPMKRIGYITNGSGICFVNNGLWKNKKLKPFSHFGESTEF
ncbi:Thiamine-monophosphate kinase [Candidatus Bandiella woodruffii]|uniref:Thiamine-monophosphate kinase n=1 Tax=Candidatus Bandiella euplotis TaxID=1664265 RepID=A0ABZ0ULM4_9RICK|nr:Thiamine-monophosphate kinase [Candidatus Bandiella woodruffii]